MKKIVVVILLALLAGALSGCASFGSMNDANDWRGFMGTDTFDNHSVRQLALREEEARVETAILLQEKLRVAIANGNTADVDKIVDMMQKIGGTEAGGCKKLRLRNETNFLIRVESLPFDGNELNPGAETSKTFCVPIGSYRMEYKECDATGGRCRNASASIYIDRNRVEPLVVRHK